MDELFAAYMKFAKRKKLKTQLLLSTDGHMMAKVKGKNAGKLFSREPGKHCCQRIPKTESKGRKHTSTVSVAVLMVPKVARKGIPDRELKIEAVNLGGKGGQHQNRTLSGCRMTHLPSRTVVTINGRDFHSNVKDAREIMEMRIWERSQRKLDRDRDQNRKRQMKGGSRGDKDRTYNFMEGRAVDHRNGKKTSDVKGIMKGKLELLM